MRLSKLLLTLMICSFGAGLCFAQSTYIPKPLTAWEDWVMEDFKSVKCPFLSQSNYGQPSSHICIWSGPLTLDASQSGAQFSQQWRVFQESYVPLPGDTLDWPRKVKVNGDLYPVVQMKTGPAIKLAAGDYTIVGEFIWQSIPQSISVASQTPFVSLTIDGKHVTLPRVEDSELWFQNTQPEQQQDEVDIAVARKLSDGEYVRLETLLTLSVSGSMREVVLGKVLPDGFDLLGIESDMPSYLDEKGLLHAKLKPGEWTINVIGYAFADQISWQRPQVSHVWPEQEVWVFQGDESLRQVKFNGGVIVDSEQAVMPQQWYALPAYLITEKDTVSLTVQHRGMPLHMENTLQLDRNLWLAFDHQSFDFVDRINGAMVKDWRLSSTLPLTLLSADDTDGSALITSLSDNERGIETRYPAVNIEARGVINKASTLPVSGWEQDFESVSVTLHLPPGNELFAVFGADSVSSSWWSNWSIWSSFIVLLTAIAAGRLFSLTVGLLTGVTLMFIYQQSGAPLLAMFNLLLAYGARKHLNFDSIKHVLRWYLTASIGIALAAILFFAASQIRVLVFPQLERAGAMQNSVGFYEPQDDSSRLQSIQSSVYKGEEQVEKITVTGSRIRVKDSIERYQADAKVQAGAGIPEWTWKRYQLEWLSPVAVGQDYELIIFNTNIARLFNGFGIALLIMWLALVAKSASAEWLPQIRRFSGSAAILLVFLVPNWAPKASASDLPDQALLDALQQRLLTAPECAPQCASIDSMTVITTDKLLTLKMTVHAQQQTFVPLPRSEFWRPEDVRKAGVVSASLVLKNGWIYLLVDPGIHTIDVSGELVGVDSLQLLFKQYPRFVDLKPSTSWDIVGVQGSTLSGNSLTFLTTKSQQQSDGQTVSRLTSNALVKVSRQITMDQTWRVLTVVERIAPSKGSLTVQVPTLPGEYVTSSEVLMDDQRVNVTLSAGESSYSWRSNLQRQPTIALTATADAQLIEHWTLIASPSWHTETSGVPRVMAEQISDDYFTLHFYPQRGETLLLDTTRPDAIEGESLAIDSVTLEIEKGARTETLSLEVNYRSTRGGEHTISLPTDYTFKQVSSDQKLINIQPEDNTLTLPIFPGSHTVNIELRASLDTAIWYQTPDFDLNAPVSNINTKISMTGQRWILWTKGPTIGPVVLYWGELLVFILLAFVLTRIKFSPLSPAAWIILGLGLSLNNWSVLVMTALWFAAITASEMRSKTMPIPRFNTTQVFLFLFSAITLTSLIATVPFSLLSSPDMGIAGNYSSNYSLNWFADKSAGLLPDIAIVTLPIWIYKGIMLLWVIWLSFSIVSWTKWAWKKLGEQGYWKKPSPVITSSHSE